MAFTRRGDLGDERRLPGCRRHRRSGRRPPHQSQTRHEPTSASIRIREPGNDREANHPLTPAPRRCRVFAASLGSIGAEGNNGCMDESRNIAGTRLTCTNADCDCELQINPPCPHGTTYTCACASRVLANALQVATIDRSTMPDNVIGDGSAATGTLRLAGTLDAQRWEIRSADDATESLSSLSVNVEITSTAPTAVRPSSAIDMGSLRDRRR